MISGRGSRAGPSLLLEKIALFTHQQGYIVSDTFTFDKSVELLVFVILGGACSLFGALIGTTILVVLPEVLKTAGSYDILPKSALGLQVGLVVLGGAGALGLWRVKRHGPLRAALVLGTLIGFIGYMLLTPQIIEHFLLVYGVLLIVFLVTMPDGVAGFLRDLPGLRRLTQTAPPGPGTPPASPGEIVALVPPEQRVPLHLEDVEMRFGGLRAVDGVSLAVYPGEIVALIGSNGAGKTTTLRAISGTVPVAEGSVAFDGQSIVGLRSDQIVRRGLAHIPEARQIFGDQSVYDNLRRFPVLLERRTQRAGTLSGGEQQMLTISRGLMSQPKMLLMDEPSMGLAPLLVRQVAETIVALNAQGVTILLVEQMASMALAVADRAYVIQNGEVRLSGPSAEVANNPEVVRAYLGGAAGLGQRSAFCVRRGALARYALGASAPLI